MISESGFLRRFKEHFLPELYFDQDEKVIKLTLTNARLD